MNNLTKKKFKKKIRSCPLCKPHKMHWEDNRKISDKKADEEFLYDLREQDTGV